VRLKQYQALRLKNNAASNKSLDVRAKQRLSYQRRPLIFTLSLAVSPHVNSIVLPLRSLTEKEV
jgi:hypothetical protein